METSKALNDSDESETYKVPQLLFGEPVVDPPTMAPDPTTIGLQFQPDTVLDSWQLPGGLHILASSIRGESHRASGSPREDDVAVLRLSDTAIAIAVADGVSSAQHACIASSSIVRYCTQHLLSFELNDTQERPTTDYWTLLAKSCSWTLTEKAASLGGTASDVNESLEYAASKLATTLTVCRAEQISSSEVIVEGISIGDSVVTQYESDDDRFNDIFPLLTDDNEVFSSAVLALPYLPKEISPFSITLKENDRLLIGTDGFGSPFGSGSNNIGQLYISMFAESKFPTALEFLRALDFKKKTFDDDRTLVALGLVSQ